MRYNSFSAAGAAAMASLAAAPVFAQPQPTVILAFTSGNSAVPLSPWASVALALVILAIAAAIFRRRTGGRTMHGGFWIAVIAAAGSATIGGLPGNPISSAQAIVPFLALSSSPASIVVGASQTSITAENVTTRSITIVSVTLSNPVSNQILNMQATTCVPGLVLAPSQTCIIQVDLES